MTLAEDLVAFIKTNFAGVPVYEIVAPAFGTDTDFVLVVNAPEPVPQRDAFGDSTNYDADVIISVVGHTHSTVKTKTREIIDLLDEFNGLIGNTQIVSAYMTGQDYERQNAAAVETSTIEFEITIEQ